MTTNGILTIRQKGGTARVPVLDGDTIAITESDTGRTVIEIDVRLTEGELRNRIVQAEMPVPDGEVGLTSYPAPRGVLARLRALLR